MTEHYYDPEKIIEWQLQKGRHNMPWQGDNPYHVWLSEIMLQQTQVIKVMDYFQRFIDTLPTLADLAQADEQTVLALWSGLGYYNRARNLHKTAKLCAEKHQGRLPVSRSELEALPGIGRSTAAAICSLAYNQPEVIMDGNVKRVFARQFMVAGEPNKAKTVKQFWQLAERYQKSSCPGTYTQGLMDLGAMVCKKNKPLCEHCPIEKSCLARQRDRIHEYPEKKKKVVQKVINIHVAFDETSNGLFLEKRSAQGIWPDLWFLPIIAVESHRKPMFVVSHKLTHRLMHIHVYDKRAIQQKKTKGQHIERSALLKYPHPKALIHILDQYDNHHMP